jgi:hypothetical protein
MSFDGTFGGPVDAVKAAASLSHSKSGRCGLVAGCSQRFDVSSALRQNVSVRYAGGLYHGIWFTRRNAMNFFMDLGE